MNKIIKKRIAWNKGKKGICKPNKGSFKKGNLPWMKGRSHTKKSKEKNRLSHLGKMIGEDNYFYGKKHTEESKMKMSLIKIGNKCHLGGRGGKQPLKGENYEKVYGERKSKEIKKKIKEARKKQILPIKDTSIEVKIQNLLKELNIEFFTHQYMKEIEHGYQCDILIPSMNLVIECDGNYWHKYPVGLERDHIRTKELIEKGFKVLRLWEFEIKKMNIQEFRGRLLE